MKIVKIYNAFSDTPFRIVPCNEDEAKVINKLALNAGFYSIIIEAENPEAIMRFLEQYNA